MLDKMISTFLYLLLTKFRSYFCNGSLFLAGISFDNAQNVSSTTFRITCSSPNDIDNDINQFCFPPEYYSDKKEGFLKHHHKKQNFFVTGGNWTGEFEIGGTEVGTKTVVIGRIAFLVVGETVEAIFIKLFL